MRLPHILYRLFFSISFLLVVMLFCFPYGNTVCAKSPSNSTQRARKSAAKSLIEEMSETDEDEILDENFEETDSGKVSKSTKKKSTAKSKKGSSKKSTKEKTKGKTNTKGKNKGKTVPEEVVDTRTPEEREQDRMAYFRQTGIWRWPELTETQYNAKIVKQKEYLEDVKAKFPQAIYYESEHFYYLTNAPKPIALECLKYLEAMYDKLCEMFEFPKDAQVWAGKCIVCAFAQQQQFLAFEQQFFGETAGQFSSASGLAHLDSEGNVLISLFYGDISKMEARWRFIGVLVHETTHGFIHRYRARQNIPLWLNEGIADFMVSVIVPADRQPALKQRSALEKMRQFGSVGGLMTTEGRIEPWQYGVASGMVGFIFRHKPHEFKLFLDDIKDGKEWTEALQEHYKSTPEDLLTAFGRANRIPRLTF